MVEIPREAGSRCVPWTWVASLSVLPAYRTEMFRLACRGEGTRVSRSVGQTHLEQNLVLKPHLAPLRPNVYKDCVEAPELPRPGARQLGHRSLHAGQKGCVGSIIRGLPAVPVRDDLGGGRSVSCLATNRWRCSTPKEMQQQACRFPPHSNRASSSCSWRACDRSTPYSPRRCNFAGALSRGRCPSARWPQ